MTRLVAASRRHFLNPGRDLMKTRYSNLPTRTLTLAVDRGRYRGTNPSGLWPLIQIAHECEVIPTRIHVRLQSFLMLYILTMDWERLIIRLEVSLALFVVLCVLPQIAA